ncbi:hypothetical protein FHG87_014495 [Trinorchestia longiramus]|nr:hypothetical protein FHG87_014495 [Trinorchestia longiramus]
MILKKIIHIFIFLKFSHFIEFEPAPVGQNSTDDGPFWNDASPDLEIIRTTISVNVETRNARCVEEDSGMRYLVGIDEECNMTVVDAMKDFLVYAWNKRQGG